MIRSVTKSSTAEQLELLRDLHHPNIVESLELYTSPYTGGYFLVSEFLPTTVHHLCQAPIYPTEPQLSSILHQVLTGVDFLLTHGLVYEQISATNLLMSPAGDVKICDVECCNQGDDISRLSESFSGLMMMLMGHENVGSEEAILVRPDHWSPEVVDIFHKAVSNIPIQELLGHRFLRKREQEALVWLVQFVLSKGHYPPE